MTTIKSLLLIAVIACNFVACQSGDQEEESGKDKDQIDNDMINNPEGGDPDEKKFGEFNFKKETHDFGKVVEGKKVAHTFRFTNQGNAPLVIDKAEVSCGCTVPNYPRDPVQPGESASMDVVFDSDGRSGKFKKSITIMANTGKKPKVLHIEGQVAENK